MTTEKKFSLTIRPDWIAVVLFTVGIFVGAESLPSWFLFIEQFLGWVCFGFFAFGIIWLLIMSNNRNFTLTITPYGWKGVLRDTIIAAIIIYSSFVQHFNDLAALLLFAYGFLLFCRYALLPLIKVNRS